MMPRGGAAWQAPLRWPLNDSAPQVGHGAYAERLLMAAVVFAMLALTVLDRFGLRVTSSFSAAPALMAMYGLAAAMVLTGAAELNLRAALAYLGVVVVTGLSLVVNGAFLPPAYLSASSFLLLVTLYAPFAVSLRQGAVSPQLWCWTVRLYVAFALLVAVAGIAQFFLQFVYRAPWLFDYTPLIPEAFRATAGWNTVYATGDWIKSNGFFLREPSIFSIVMAIGLLCEVSLARRKWVMATLAAGLLLSYSGSGLLALAVAMLFPLGARTVLRVLASALIAAAVYFAFGEALNLDYTANRAEEIQSDRSSAYCRFVYPGVVVLQQIDTPLSASVLGHGPGSMERMGATCAEGHETTYAKVLFEYGLAGAFAFAVLLLGALRRSAAPLRLRVALGLSWALLGGNLLAADMLLFIYVLLAMWPEGSPDPATRAA